MTRLRSLLAPSLAAACLAGLAVLGLATVPCLAADADPGEALREAARQGDADTVRRLLGQGVDVDAANDYGATALSYAADKGHVEVLRLLLEAGADPDVRDTFYSSSPAAWASYNGHADAVALLLEKGSDDAEGALTMAVFRRMPEVAKAVVKSGKAPKEVLGRALAMTRQFEADDVAAVLEEAGAELPPPSDFELPAEALARFAGTYTLEPAQNLDGVLDVREGALSFTFAGQPSLPLEPVDATTFRARGFPATFRFELDEQRVTGFVLEQEGAPEPARFSRRPDEAAGDAEVAELREEDAGPGDDAAGGGAVAAGEAEAVAEVKVPKGAADVHWPAFRGPNAAGTAQGDPPVTWDLETGENVRFRTPIPGRGHSSPIVWGDRLFVTTAVSDEDEGDFRHGLYGDVDVVDTGDAVYSWRLVALDKRSGEVLWQRVAHEGEPRSAHHMKATQVNSTPVTDGEHLVAMMGSEGLFCWDMQGELKWRKDLGALDVGWFYDPSYEWGHASSPILHDGKVIVQADLNRDPFIAAYSLEDGREVWRTRRDNLPSWGTPTLVEGPERLELVTNGSRRIRAYDPRTGRELWHLAPTAEVTVGTPVTGHGLVFVTASYRPIRPIYAIRPGGEGDISLPEGAESGEHVAWWTERGGTYMPTPIVYGEHLYTNSNNGVLGCWNARTGERLYRERIAGKGGTAFTASPVAAAGRLYLSSEDGDVYVVEAGPSFERLAVNALGEVIMATPAISEDALYVRTLGHLVGLAAPPEGDGAAAVEAAGR